MLLTYSVKNFKSIKNKSTIDFQSKSIKEHKEHLINNDILPIISIYGPNGGGKSCIIESIIWF